MRVTRCDRWRLLILVCIGASLITAAALAFADGSGVQSDVSRGMVAASAEAQQSAGAKLKAGSKRLVGSFELRKGQAVRVSTVDTVDGAGCLIEEDGEGESSSCLEGGLFTSRRAELVVSSIGGPERFDELHLTGVAAPDVRTVQLVKTDGAVVDLPLTPQRGFVFESPVGDLDADVYPTALRLLGANGRLIETVAFPAAG
jgi:hypothetical protein